MRLRNAPTATKKVPVYLQPKTHALGLKGVCTLCSQIGTDLVSVNTSSCVRLASYDPLYL